MIQTHSDPHPFLHEAASHTRAVVVKKFGGTSLATLDHITHVAQLIKKSWDAGEKPVVVVSAMARVTKDLLKWVHHMTNDGIDGHCNAPTTVSTLGLDMTQRKAPHGQPVDGPLFCQGIETEAKENPRENSKAGTVKSPGIHTTDALYRYRSESDVVVSVGEQITAGLLTLALKRLGLEARSWLGWQVPIITNDVFTGADIEHIETAELLNDLDRGIIPVVAGFQGVTRAGRITTLGLEGSDTTAVALASFLKAKYCAIFTDVPGVFSADPRYIAQARHYPSISYDDMERFGECGARVLHPKAAAWGKTRDIPIHIVSTFEADHPGTRVSRDGPALKGVAWKEVVFWKFAQTGGGGETREATDMQAISASILHFFQEQEISYIHWRLSEGELTFMTCADTHTLLQSHLPKAEICEEMTLITVMGGEASLWAYLQAESTVRYQRVDLSGGFLRESSGPSSEGWGVLVDKAHGLTLAQRIHRGLFVAENNHDVRDVSCDASCDAS